MNILTLLTPKKDVKFLTTNQIINDALDVLRVVRFSSVPLLDNDGYFVGTITEGDLLWHLEKHGLANAKIQRLKDVKRIRDYTPVHIDATMDELVDAALGQNFIPILDDRKYFIGLVTRKDLLSNFINNFNKKAEIIHENPILNAIYKRRSIRKFKKGIIEEKVLAEILKVALVSPTASNRRAHHIMLIDDPEVIMKLSTLHHRGGQFEKAPYLILSLNDTSIEDNAYNANSNSSALLMSLLLTIDSFENLGGFWVATRSVEHNKAMLEYLNVPAHYDLYGIVAFGIKNEFKAANEPMNFEKIHKNQW
jgi:nitroreductase/CBS domain-containing protein